MSARGLRDRLAGELDAMLEETAALVAIDSGSYDPAGVNAVSARMTAPLEALGFTVQRAPLEGRGDRVAATLALGDGPKVAVLGHADTVWPAGTAAGWPLHRGGRPWRPRAGRRRHEGLRGHGGSMRSPSALDAWPGRASAR